MKCPTRGTKEKEDMKAGVAKVRVEASIWPFPEGKVLENVSHPNLPTPLRSAEPQLPDPLWGQWPSGGGPGLHSELTATSGLPQLGPLMVNSAWGRLEMLICCLLCSRHLRGESSRFNYHTAQLGLQTQLLTSSEDMWSPQPCWKVGNGQE